MKTGDKEKLDQCLTILDSTDLGLSMVWLWTWSTIQSFREDETMSFKMDNDEVWDRLCKAVESGAGFSLEYGAEQHYEEVRDWLIDNDIMVDTMFEDEDE